MSTKTILGLEALVRWQHPTRGLLSPAAFRPGMEIGSLAVWAGMSVLEDRHDLPASALTVEITETAEVIADHLYRRPLHAGLDEERRPRAAIQLASTLRNLGRTDEAISLLTAEIEASLGDGLDDARAAFLALALHDAGHHGRALFTALAALAPHLPAYGRAVVQYAG